MAAKGPARASLRYAKAPLSPRYQWELHQLLGHCCGFSGESVDTVLDYFYFSVVSYTSLGLGDIFPTDHLRLLTGVEALTGLLLIAWSGAYLFAMMNRLWDWPPCAEPDKPKK